MSDLRRFRFFTAMFELAVLLLLTVSAFSAADGPSNPVFGGTADRDWQGDRVFLGSYEQDGDETNGPEPVLWRVLRAEEGRLLLLSEYGLETRPFHSKPEAVTWETADLRGWLNTDFLDQAFADRGNWKQSFVLEHATEASSNRFYGTDGGNATRDRVFLLAWEDLYNESYGFPEGFTASSRASGEQERYAEVSPAALCYPTLHAAKQDALITRSHNTRKTPNKGEKVDGFGTVYWILRTPGATQEYITYVSRWGRTTIRFLSPVDHTESVIRPAVEIDCSLLSFSSLKEGLFCADVDEAYSQACIAALDYRAEIQERLSNQPEREVAPLSPTNRRTVNDLTNPIPGGNSDGQWEGDRVYFGSYQDQPVLWRVLRSDDTSLLLLSEYGLEKRAFDQKKGTTCWADSSVRRYLNEKLLSRLFSPSEAAAIQLTSVRNEANPRYGTQCGPDTEDRMFLLSYEECASVAFGFSGEEGDLSVPRPIQSNTRICLRFGSSPSRESAVFGKKDDQGNQIWHPSKTVRWLLRTSGFTDGYICDVDTHGDAFHHELSSISKKLWLRPAITVSKSALILECKDDDFPTLIPLAEGQETEMPSAAEGRPETLH